MALGTFGSRVQDLVGTISDTSLMEDALTTSASEFLTLLPPEKLGKMAEATEISSDGLTISNEKVISVHKDGYAATEVPRVNVAAVKDVGSIKYATSRDPVFYLEAGKIFVVANGVETTGTMMNVTFPGLINGTGSGAVDSGTILPIQYESIVILGAAIKCRINQIHLFRVANMTPLVIISVVPATPSAPTFSYTNAEVADLVGPFIDIADMAALTASAPAFIPPTFTISTLTGISHDYPVPPVAPIMGEHSIKVPSSVPVFTPPPMASLDYADIEKWITDEEDAEMLSARVQAIGTKIQEFSARLQSGVQEFNDANTEFQADLQVAIQNAQLEQHEDTHKLQIFSADLQKYQAEVGTRVQENQARLTQWQGEESLGLQKYQADMQNNLNVFNEQQVVFQEDVQRTTQNFQKDMQVATQQFTTDFGVQQANMSKDVQIELQNSVQQFQADMQLFQSEMGKYSAEVQTYGAQVSTEVQEKQATMASHQQSYAGLMGELQGLQQQYAQMLQMLIGG